MLSPKKLSIPFTSIARFAHDLRQPRVDCHVHLFGPARFPSPEDNFYRPAGGEIASAAPLGHLMDAAPA